MKDKKYLPVFLFFIIGIVFGSFLTCLSIRWSNNKSIIKPGSYCDSCGKSLNWYDLIPVLSFVINKGKCRYCKKDIPKIDIIIELLCGILFSIGGYLYHDYNLLVYLVIVILCVSIIVSDFLYLIILDRMVFISLFLVLLIKFIFLGYKVLLSSILASIIIFLLLYIIKILGDFVFKKESLGGGDIKLGLFIGATLGIKLSLISIVLASFIALPYAIYVVVKKKESLVPFGPFLIIATLICFIFSNVIISLLNYLFVL